MPPYPTHWFFTFEKAITFAVDRARAYQQPQWVRKIDGKWRVGVGDPR